MSGQTLSSHRTAVLLMALAALVASGCATVDFDYPKPHTTVLERTAGTLHTKAFVVDRQRLFLGSFNLDPRSAYINNEMGVIIDSPELARRVTESVDQALSKAAYQVILSDDGSLRWVGYANGEQEVWKKEPQTGFWRRLHVSFMRVLSIKGQL